jgi:hypothetical protein
MRTGDTRNHLVVIGGGQAAKWLLIGLAERLARGERRLAHLRISVIERGWEFATGLAWSRHYALPEHQTSLAEPVSRVRFGDEQRLQFHETVDLLRQQGIGVDLRRGIEVIELRRHADGRLLVKTAEGIDLHADAAVLATGHWQAPDPLMGTPGYHDSPWPAVRLQESICERRAGSEGGACRHVLILGTYLNAIDTVISLALKMGEFSRQGERRAFRGPSNFRMTMASRRGHLPRVWGRAPATSPPRFLTAAALDELRSAPHSAGFLPLVHCLDLLEREIVGSGSPVSRLRSLVGKRHKLQRCSGGGVTARAVRRRLEADLRSVFSPAAPSGRYEDTNEVAWQAALFTALPVVSEYSHALSAEDQYLFDQQLRTTFFQHAMPMTLESASMLRALMESGHLSVIALGQQYACTPVHDGFVLKHGVAGGQQHTLQFTDVVRACTTSSDIRNHPAALFQSALRSGLVQPAARAFRDASSAEWIAAQAGAAAVIQRRNQPLLVAGGIQVNPRTREVLAVDEDEKGMNQAPLFAMGPNLIGQFLDAHSLGQLIRDSACILSRLAAVQDGVQT